MKNIFKIIFGVVALAAVAAGVVYAVNAPVAAEAVTVAETQAAIDFSEQGYVKADNKTNVYAVAAGRLVSVNVEENQDIKKGDIICVIDAYQYENQILQLQGGISGYEAQIGNLSLEEKKAKDGLIYSKQSLQSEYNALIAQENGAGISKFEQERLQNILIEQGRKDLAAAQDNLDKGSVLYQSGVLPKKDYDDLVNGVNMLASALDGAVQQLEVIKAGTGQNSAEYFNGMKASLQAQINSIDNSMSKSYTQAMREYYQALIETSQASIALLNRQIADCTVVSPVDGKIAALYVKNANVVGAQSPVAMISGEMDNEIEVFVSTKDIDAVTVGDTVEIILRRQQGDYSFGGKVAMIDTEATAQISALGVEERKVKVTIAPQEAGELRPGYDADVKFTTFWQENALTVPKTAVYKDNETGKDMVWAVRNGKAETVEVVLGTELRTEYIVDGGLAAGDVVVKDVNTSGLRKGVNIKVE